MPQSLLNELLDREEGQHLEFKQQVDLKSDEGKAKFLREVLALANSTRELAHMVIGVEDKTKALIGVTGITEEQLQQLVAAWCKPPIEMEYRVVEQNQVEVGILEIIGAGRRPHTLQKALRYPTTKGHRELQPNQVFLRRGSTSVEGTLEEIIQIAQEDRGPDAQIIADAIHSANRSLRYSIASDLAEIESTLTQIKWRLAPDGSDTDSIFVSILAGGLVGWYWQIHGRIPSVLPFTAWFVVAITTSALHLNQFTVLGTIGRTLWFGVALLLGFGLILMWTEGTLLPFPHPLIEAIITGLIVGALFGTIADLPLIWLRNKMR